MNRVIAIKDIVIGAGMPKVCVSILGKTEEEVLDEAGKINSLSCDLIEFRADYYENFSDESVIGRLLTDIRRICNKPIIFTYRSKNEGGLGEIPEALYYSLNLYVAENNYAELIDIEATLAARNIDIVKRIKKTGTHVILSVHDFHKTPLKADILRSLFHMKEAGADIVKAAFMPETRKDVLNLMEASDLFQRSSSACPSIIISMGHLGLITRTMCEFMGSAITFASLSKEGAPGQLSAKDVSKVINIVHKKSRLIFLAGFMGTGKSTVANELGIKYGFKKMDLDSFIEEHEKMTISDIFSKESEQGFREKETKYLKKLLEEDYQVISLGGGAILKEENISLIRNHGTVILLTASPETIRQRVANDSSRPLLANVFDLEYIQKLMKDRENKYRKAAHLEIDTTDKSIAEICKEIVATLGISI